MYCNLCGFCSIRANISLNIQKLQCQFSKTYRYLPYESNSKLTIKQKRESIKKRHREFYWMGRYLRECIECFGSLPDIFPKDNFRVYHGISRHVTFSSVYPYIKGHLVPAEVMLLRKDFLSIRV